MNSAVWSTNRVRSEAASRVPRSRQSLPGKSCRNAAATRPAEAPAGKAACRVKLTRPPGCSSGVPASAAAATKAFTPNNRLSPMLSGDDKIVPRNTSLTPPSVTASPGCRPSDRAAAGSSSSPGCPSGPRASPANCPGGSLVTCPSNGQLGPTARAAASSRRPDGATKIERVSTVSDTRAPRATNHAGTAAGNAPSPVDSSKSPPRMPRLPCAIPWSSAARSEPMPATAATPTARHSSTISSPLDPPRKSRRASRQARRIMPRSRPAAASACGRSAPPAPDHA